MLQTTSNRCRLCVKICSELKNLYDENGRANKLYDITISYFNPLILNMQKCKHLTAICRQCWRYLLEFHNFQKTVIEAQTKLNDEQSAQEVFIKNEPKDFEELAEATTSQEVSSHAMLHMPADPDSLSVYNEARSTNATTSKDNDSLLEYMHDNENNSDTEQQGLFSADESQDTVAINKDIIKIEDDSDSDGSDDMPLAKRLKLQKKSRKFNASAYAWGKCFKRFLIKLKNVNLDELLAQWIPDIGCTQCPVSFPKLKQVKEHFRVAHPNQRFYIQCCNRKLIDGYFIKDHLLNHIDPAFFKCELCETNCSSRGSLQKHYTNCHKDGKHRMKPQGQMFTCTQCGKQIQSAKSLMTHVYKQHTMKFKYHCTLCDKAFKIRDRFNEHMASHTKTFLYACAFCPLKFRSMSSICNHRKVVHPKAATKNSYRRIGGEIYEKPKSIREKVSEMVLNSIVTSMGDESQVGASSSTNFNEVYTVSDILDNTNTPHNVETSSEIVMKAEVVENVQFHDIFQSIVPD